MEKFKPSHNDHITENGITYISKNFFNKFDDINLLPMYEIKDIIRQLESYIDKNVIINIDSGIYEHDIFNESHDINEDHIVIGKKIRKISVLSDRIIIQKNIYRKITQEDINNVVIYMLKQAEKVSPGRTYCCEDIFCDEEDDNLQISICWAS